MTESEDDEHSCPCGAENHDNPLSVKCQTCKCRWHLRCCGLLGLTQSPIAKIESQGWRCPRCFELPIHIQPPKKSSLSQETIDNIVSIVNSTVEDNLNTLLSAENLNVGAHIEEGSQAEEKFKLVRNKRHERSVQKALEEQREEDLLIEKKKDNLVIFGMPEADTDVTKDELLEDFRRITSIYEGRVEIKQEDIKHMTRIGAKSAGKIRPIQITLDPSKRKDLLTKNRDLKLLENNTSTPIYVSPDRTKKQREADKELREELKRRKLTDKNLVIRNGKIVPFHQRAQNTTTWASIINE